MNNIVIIYGSIMMLVLNIITVCSAETITGRVINSSSTALANAKVWLKSFPAISDSTGSDGKFALNVNPTSIIPFAVQKKGGARSFAVLNNKVEFTLTSTQRVSIEMFTICGRKTATIFNGIKTAGKNTITISQHCLLLASGFHMLRFISIEATFNARVMIADGRLFTNFQTGIIQNGNNTTAETAKTDSLIVLRMGYAIKKLPLMSAETTDVGDISLTMRTYALKEKHTVKTGRNIEVYVPSDYDELYTLPVLYLLHGGGDTETAWTTKGALLDTLNKSANRENVQAMIIVLPNAGGSTGYGNYGKTGDPFYRDLTVDIKNYIEENYIADTARFSRAVSGLSMGSMQTWNLTLFYPELWGYSMPMSAGLLRSSGFTESKLTSDATNGEIDTASVNQLKLFRVFSNPTDIAYDDTKSTCTLMEKLKIKHTTDYTTNTSGGHTWPFWNEVFGKYASSLFK